MTQQYTKKLRLLLLPLVLLMASQISAQIIMLEPVPAGGSSAWTKICAGIDNGSGPFNSYDMTLSWGGSLPNAGNAFILELSDANGDFTNAIELANVTDQNTNNTKTFDVTFSIPTDTRGNGYKFRARSTNPATEEETAVSFEVYYMSITSNLNISELGDGVPPGTICSSSSVTLQVDNIPNPEAYKYIWYRNGSILSETSHTITADTSGMYQALVDYGDCTLNANTDSNFVTVTIGSSGSGVTISTPSRTALCAGETETLTVDVPDAQGNYEWFKDGVSVGTGTSFVVDGNTVGFEGGYAVEISGTDMCTERSEETTITNAGEFNVTRTNDANFVLLPSQTETLTITTDATSPTYEWFRNGSSIGNDSPNLSITEAGTYYAAVTSGGACSSTINSETTEVVSPSSFEIVIDYNGSYAACENTSTELQVAQINANTSAGSSFDVTSQLVNDFSYQWQKDGADISGASSQNISLTDLTENGTYSLHATLNSETITSNDLEVQLLTSETVNITSTGTIFCSTADALTISTTTDLNSETFTWEKDGELLAETETELVVDAIGTYRLVLDKNGCDLYSNEIVITGLDPNLITIDEEGDIVFPEGSSKTVTASGGTGYQWLDETGTVLSTADSMTFTEEGTFNLIANIDNCQISRQVTSVFLDTFKVPNVITPNGDGSNDQWVIPNSYSNRSDVSVVIYNDQGVELVNETSYQNNWPQSSSQFPSQNMVFYYVIKNAEETLKQGTITVIR